MLTQRIWGEISIGSCSVSVRGLGGDVSELVMTASDVKKDHDTYICSCGSRHKDINKNKYHMAHSGLFVFQLHHLRRGCCGKRMGGGGITCDWAGTPASWSWYLPGSVGDQGRSEQSASSVTRGLWGKWRGRETEKMELFLALFIDRDWLVFFFVLATSRGGNRGKQRCCTNMTAQQQSRSSSRMQLHELNITEPACQNAKGLAGPWWNSTDPIIRAVWGSESALSLLK